MDFPRIRSTFGVTPYAPGRKRPLERDEEDTIADIPNPEMMQKEPEIYDRPFPPGIAAQEAFDDMLQRRIVDPLAKAGYEDVGAGFAAIPSAAHSMIVPQSEFDVAGTLIPLPGVAKLMKKGKFRKISKAMHVEDPENAAEIIAKQASKEGGPVNLDPEAQKIAKVKQEKFLRKQTDDPTKKELSYQDGLTFKGGFANYDNPEEILKQYNDAIKSPSNNTYVGSNIADSFTVDPTKGVGPARQVPIDPSHMAKTSHIGSGVELGNPDPLAWMDIKKGVTRDWLINTKGTPRLIETQSDLISHDDYMSNLMPGDRVVFHIYTDNGSLSRVINPGAASPKRLLQAAEKLAKAGIDVKIVKNSPDTLKTLPNHDVGDINAIKLKDSGIKFEERNLALDEAQESRLRKMLGMEAKAPKDPRSDFRKMQDDLSEFAVKPKGEAKTPLKSVEPPKSEKEKWSKILREDDEIDAEKNQQAIDEALKRIQDRKNKPKIVEPPKPPKGESLDALHKKYPQLGELDPRLRFEGKNLEKRVDEISEELDYLDPRFPEEAARRAKLESELREIIDHIENSNKPRIIKTDSPKGPKGDPEASLPRQPDKFSAIRSQLDVAPSRMDERGKAFGDVGQSEFLPDSRPMPRFEEVPRRNYVESEMDPVQQTFDKWKNTLDPKELESLNSEKIEFVKKYIKHKIDFNDYSRVYDNAMYQSGGYNPTKGQQYDASILRSQANSSRPSFPDRYAMKKHFPLKSSEGILVQNPELIKIDKIMKESGVGHHGLLPSQEAIKEGRRIYDGNMDEKLEQAIDRTNGVRTPARQLQDRMYKGRPSHEAEQAKLFPKVKEAVKGERKVREKFRIVRADGKDVTSEYGSDENLAGLTQKELQDMVDPSGKKYKVVSAVTPEESQRLLEEKLKDF